MKVKLLKKIRKRFEIHHYPNGIVRWREHYDYNLFVLTDNTTGHEDYAQLGREPGRGIFTEHVFGSEKECMNYLTGLIVPCLIYEGYRTKKMNDTVVKSKKVWYIE